MMSLYFLAFLVSLPVLVTAATVAVDDDGADPVKAARLSRRIRG